MLALAVELVDGRARIEPAGKGRDHAQPTRLQGLDHGVVVRGVAGQQVRAQQQQADRRRFGILPLGQLVERGADAAPELRVIQPDFGVLDRLFGLGQGAQAFTRAHGVTVHQGQHHVFDVVLAAAEPVAHGLEEQAQILRGAGDEAQQLGQAAQHGHLAGAGVLRASSFAFGLGLGRRAQFFQDGHESGGLLAHDELAHARELHHRRRRHDADHGVAALAARLQGVEHRQEVVFHEQHADDHQVGLRHGGVAVGQGLRVSTPVGRAVDLEAQPRQPLRQAQGRVLRRTGQVVVHGQQHHAHAGCGGGACLSG